MNTAGFSFLALALIFILFPLLLLLFWVVACLLIMGMASWGGKPGVFCQMVVHGGLDTYLPSWGRDCKFEGGRLDARGGVAVG